MNNLQFLLLLQEQPGAGSGGIGAFMPMLIMLVSFYLLVVLPQQRRQRKALIERQQFINSLKLGDRVVTAAGLYGTIVALRGDNVHLKIAPSVSVTITRSSIVERATSEIEEPEAVDT